MKIFKNNIALLLLFLVAMASCEDDMRYTGQLDNMPRNLKIDKTRISVDSEAGEVSWLKVTSENTSWVIKNIPAWLEVTPETGDGTTNVKVSAKENIALGARREVLLEVESTVPTYECVREVTVVQAFKTNGYEAVDLGLPGAVFWATCNLGASIPEANGNYYAWGETYVKNSYTMYNTNLYGSQIYEISGNESYDAARSNMGHGWSIPTMEDVKTLMASCSVKDTKINGVAGYKVTGPNGNHIFLPACGYRSNSTVYNSSVGCYWTSTSYDDIYYAQAMLAESNRIDYTSFERYYGLGIRPVFRGFVIDKDTLGFDYSASFSNVNIESIVGWRFSENESWITCSYDTDSSLKISVDEYSGVDSRSGEIKFYHSDDERVLGTLVINQSGILNREYVDLGLPSGLKWATCNVGSSTPEGYGNFYAWGEIEPKSRYTQSTYTLSGQNIGDYSGNPSYDVAAAKWGEGWRTPTLAEYHELIDCCTWKWTTSKGVKGFRITGPSGNSIFMPAAGEFYREPSLEGTDLRFWTSTPYNEKAYCLNASSSILDMRVGYAYLGLSVRPVTGGNISQEYFSLETDVVNSGKYESEHSVKVNTTIDWTVESSDSWATPVKVNNSELLVTVSENTVASSRSATITLRRSSNGEVLGVVTVNQDAAEGYFEVNPTYFVADDEAGEYTVDVNTNYEWRVDYSATWLRVFDSFADWTSYNHEGGSTSTKEYTLDVSAGSVLDFDWYVNSESGYDWLVITLDGDQIIRKSGNESGHFTKTFDAAGSHELVVTYSKDESGDSGEDLGRIYNITLTGNRTPKLIVAVDENTLSSSRTESVIFRRRDNGEELGSVIVNQEGKSVAHESFSLETTVVNFDQGSSTRTVAVTTNINWYVQITDGWVSAINNENSSVTLTVEENTSSSQRTTQVVFRRRDNDEELGRLRVNQAGLESYFSIETSVINFDYSSSSYTVGVNTNISWYVERADNWINVTKDGNSAFTVTAEANLTSSSRTTVLTVRRADDSSELATLTVNQNSMSSSFSLSRNSIEAGATTSIFFVNVDASIAWSVESAYDWITITKHDDTLLEVNVNENRYVHKMRTGEIVFRDSYNNVLATLPVTQRERELSVSHSRIELPLEGGESRTVTINAVGEYSISSNGDWFTVNHDHENNTLTVVADANQNDEDRTGTVVVALEGDPDGDTKYVTIDVVQYAGDINFDLGDFDEDKEWN